MVLLAIMLFDILVVTHVCIKSCIFLSNSRSARTGDDIREIRNILDSSLSNVARDPNLDSILLEQEARKLDESIGGGIYLLV